MPSDEMKHPRTPNYSLRRAIGVLCFLVLAPIVAVVMLLLYLIVQNEPARFDAKAAKGISYTPLVQIVPGPGMPEGLGIMKSTNNVDVIRSGGRWYMAFRTAPVHFASTKTALFVVGSDDRKTWKKEAEFHLNKSDLREPRFLEFKGKLILYLFRGGSNPMEFAPEYIYVTERTQDGNWTEPRRIFKKGFVVWRAKARGDAAYMSVYNGSGLYTTKERPGELRLLTSTDGYNWTPISAKPQVTDMGAEEGEFEFDDEGNLVATVRLEVQGGKVCTAPKEDLSAWSCRFTPYKYDSALMFRHGKDFYVIARRNVAGPFNRSIPLLPGNIRRGWYLARYSLTRKRTALYKVDVANRELIPLFDFPSKGDTAYAGYVPIDADDYWVVNYSSPIHGFDWNWLGGQIWGGSNLYETTLKFTK